jgi:phosphoserine phosphatase RsbU/P
MRILVVNADPAAQPVLSGHLRGLGHEVVETDDGESAWALFTTSPIECVISDWRMRGLEGPELCRRIRGAADRAWSYVMLLTSRDDKGAFLEGIDAGADDCLSTPIDLDLLHARLHVANRVLALERSQRDQIDRLRTAIHEVDTLRGILPICMYCKRIKDGPDTWQAIEAYVASHSDARFSHGVCPACYVARVEPMLEELRPPVDGPPPRDPADLPPTSAGRRASPRPRAP